MQVRFLVFVAILAMFATPLLAHTGPVTGSPGDYQLIDNLLDVDYLAGITATHYETANNYQTPVYKGWWSVSLTNKTGIAWKGMSIEAGGNRVAIVYGDNLVDEWGITGNSVAVAGAALSWFGYWNPYGTVTYDNGAVGTLWKDVAFGFATPVGVGQKVSFRVYTDNAYDNNPADSFTISLTPTAVPEPSALLAMFSGLAGFIGLAIKRRS